MLANGAVTWALTFAPQHTRPTLLPFEQIAVVVDGIKITSQVALAIQFSLGKVDAQCFYTKAANQVHGSNRGGLGWSKEAFNKVDWEALSQALRLKSESNYGCQSNQSECALNRRIQQESKTY